MGSQRLLLVFTTLALNFVLVFYVWADIWKKAGIEKIGPSEAPRFVLEDVGGREFSLEDLKGRVVVLNFWATWCPPCKEEMASLSELNLRLKDSGVTVVAVNDFEPRQTVVDFAKRHNYSFTILVDEKGVVSERYRVVVLPTTFIIDREGRAVARVIGYRDWTDSNIIEALKEIAGR